MDVSTRHPSITTEVVSAWDLCGDAAAGEGKIKARGEALLPMPSGFRSQGDGGKAAYSAYKQRAQFPEIMAPSVASLAGIAHGTEIQVDLPDGLAYLFEDADGEGLPLSDLHRRITRKLLVEGRVGLLADAPAVGGDPVLALYSGPSIINWDRQFYVLNESHMAREGFRWEPVEQYRVLQLSDGRYTQDLYRDDQLIETIAPSMRGGGALTTVPFAVASAKDVGPAIEPPPLIGVALHSLAIYQLSADYRHQLYSSGQETLLVINGEAPTFVGAGAVHEMYGVENQVPDMRYVGPSCAGIAAHKDAMEDNRDAAAQAGARLFEQQSRAQESGEARALRFKSETANLQSVLQNSCGLLEAGLRNVAQMKGLDPKQVVVNAPADLLDKSLSPQEAAALWQIVKERGLSYETFFEAVQQGGLVSPERTVDDEYDLIERRDFGGEATNPEAEGLI